MQTTPVRKPNQPPPTRQLPPPPANQQSITTVHFEQVGQSTLGHRVVIYGPGGIGKTTLACQAPGPVAFIDVDESLEKLKAQLTAQGIPIPVKVPAPKSWRELRGVLQSSGWDKIKSIVIDTWAPAEILLLSHVLSTVTNEKSQKVERLEDYGYGKGFRHMYDMFLPLLSDLDRHVRAGRNVIIVCHDDIQKVPNPAGLDFTRWEPKMQHTDKASIRYRTKEWCDHVLFVNYDVAITAQDDKGRKPGKASGSGARSLYCAEQAHFLAKSRTSSDTYDLTVEGGKDILAAIMA